MRARRTGLTLIEVLIIIVMIGILLTLVVQKIRHRGTKDVTISLKADVDSVRSAESRYFAGHNAYGTRVQLDSASLLTVSPDNTVTIETTPSGYVATSKWADDPNNPRSCTLEITGESSAATARPVCH